MPNSSFSVPLVPLLKPFSFERLKLLLHFECPPPPRGAARSRRGRQVKDVVYSPGSSTLSSYRAAETTRPRIDTTSLVKDFIRPLVATNGAAHFGRVL